MKSLFLFLILVFQITRSLIHTIGDSHSFFSFTPICVLPNRYNEAIVERLDYLPFRLHWLPGATAYQISRHIVNLINRNFFQDSLFHQDVCIFSFGEIDCRCHINKHIVCDDPFSREKITDELIKRYEEALDIFNKKFAHLDLKIIILGIMPPFYKHIENVPVVGTFEQRLKNVLFLNTRLKNMAEKKGYLFLDQYKLFADKEGKIPLNQTDSWTHIKTELNYKVWDELLVLIS